MESSGPVQACTRITLPLPHTQKFWKNSCTVQWRKSVTPFQDYLHGNEYGFGNMFKSATMMEDIKFITLTTFGGQSTAYGLENPEEGS
jgi:hypothetical protein